MPARRCFAFLALLTLCGEMCGAENDLPRRQPGIPTDGSAALFRTEPGDVLPGKELPIFSEPPAELAPDLTRAKTELERAQRKEQRWQKLFKAGVIARVEAEASVLALARARAQYEQARVVEQERVLDDLRRRATAGQLSADAVGAAESALRTALAMAAEVETAFQRTQLLLAEANVDRQRRLLTLGAGSKVQLQRAEHELAQLKGAARR